MKYNMKYLFVLLSLIFLNVLFSGCSEKTEQKKDKINVFTSILPQKYFVEKIGDSRVNVDVLVQPGKNPHTYEPTPDQIMALSNSDILFTIGVPFERAFLPKIKESLTSLKIIDTSEGIVKRMLDSDDDDNGEDHESKDEHNGEHGRVPDPHIWLSPVLVKIQAGNIYKALVKIDPEGEATYKTGYNELIKELDEVNNELKEALKPVKGNILLVYHPAFGYFADEYGLKQVAIETGGKEPSPSLIVDIISRAKKQGVKVIFVQPEFSQKSAKAIADAIGGAVVMLNTLDPDYINNLKNIARAISVGLKRGS